MGEREAYAQAMRDGHVHAWAGRWREAASSYQRALEALPGDLTARSSLAAAYANGGAPAEALELLEALGAEQPNDSAVVLRLAEMRQRAGRQDLADEAYLRVADLYQATGLAQKSIGIWRRLLGFSGHRATTMRRVAAAAAAAGAAEVAAEAEALAGPSERAAAPAPVQPDPAAAPEGGSPDGVAALAAALRARGLAGAPVGPRAPAPAAGPRASLDDALAALQSEPNSPAASRLVGLAALALGAQALGRAQLARALDVAELDGDLDLAVALIGDLLPLDDDPADLHRRQIRIALTLGSAEAAADAHLALSDWLAEHGERPAALAEARQVRAVAPISARLQAAAARRLAALGAAIEADDARRRAFHLAPREPVHALAYVASSARRGALEELTIAVDAVASLWESAGGEPAAPRPELEGEIRATLAGELGGSEPPVRWARARLLATIGDPAARDDLRAVASAPPPLGPIAALALAERALAEGDPAEALAAARRWIGPEVRSDPDVPAERLAGLALSAADQVGDAAAGVAALGQLIALAPEDTTLGGLLAERLAAAGDSAGAARELARLAADEEAAENLDAAAGLYAAAIGLDPLAVGVTLRSVELARRRGDRDEARRLLLQVAAIEGEHRLSALLGAADLSPWAARVDVLRQAVEIAPDDPEPRRRLVGALVTGGQAVQAAAEAAALAEMLHLAGDRVGALAAIEQARRLDPWNPGLQALREALVAGHEEQ